MLVPIETAISILKENKPVAIPTETVYGMAGVINNEDALKSIFSIKERPFFDPLIVHVSSIKMAQKYTSNWTENAEKLAQHFWPGPLTLILDKGELVSSLITSGLDKVGLRMPDHPLTLELIEKLQTPLAAPSANKFKKTSPTCAEHVSDEFGEDFPILDGGQTQFGIESTVVGVFDDHIKIYRPGVITKDDLQDVLDIPVEHAPSPVAPGQLKHHYMPNIPITLTTNHKLDLTDYQDHYVWKLPADPVLVARELYSQFRQAAKQGHKGILIIYQNDFHQDEKWKGVLNRINKAKTYEI